MNDFSPHTESSLKNQIVLELLRQAHKTFDQAHQSFRLAILMTTISAAVSIIGVFFLISNRASEGTIAATTGLATGTGFIHLAREADKRLKVTNELLDKINADLTR